MLRASAPDFLSGIAGDSTTGLLMLFVLVVTLRVQAKTNSENATRQRIDFDKQLRIQVAQFDRQMTATKELAAQQFELERLKHEAALIHAALPDVISSALSMALIAEGGGAREDFAGHKYRGLGAIQIIKNSVRPEARQDVNRLSLAYDATVAYTSFIPDDPLAQERKKEATSDLVGAFVGVFGEWVAAYLDGDTARRAELVELADANTAAAREASGLFNVNKP